MWMIDMFDVWMNMIPGRAGVHYTRAQDGWGRFGRDGSTGTGLDGDYELWVGHVCVLVGLAIHVCFALTSLAGNHGSGREPSSSPW